MGNPYEIITTLKIFQVFLSIFNVKTKMLLQIENNSIKNKQELGTITLIVHIMYAYNFITYTLET